MSKENDNRNEMISNSQEIYETWREDQLAEDEAKILKDSQESEK